MTREIKDGFTVRDRRYWVDDEERDAEATQPVSPPETPAPPAPTIDTETLRSALADLEETKYRVRRDAEKQLDLQRTRILESLLPVVDNLERSLEAAAGAGPDVKAFAEGVRLVHQ